MKKQIIKAFLDMDLRDQDRDAHSNAAMRDQIIFQIEHFAAFALPDPAAPLLVGGFIHNFGTVTAWMVTAKGFERGVRTILPMQRQLCTSMYAAFEAHRMQIEVDTGYASNERYAEALGFEFEGIQKRASTCGGDLSIYVWPDERGLS